MKTCGSCDKSGNISYTSSPVQCKCSLTGKLHTPDHECDVKEKPRICEVFGVEVGQEFSYNLKKFRVDKDGYLEWLVGSNWELVEYASEIIELVNRPETIKRLSRLTEKELEICKALGAKWISRADGSAKTELWGTTPMMRTDEGGIRYFVSERTDPIARVNNNLFPSLKYGERIPVEYTDVP